MGFLSRLTGRPEPTDPEPAQPSGAPEFLPEAVPAATSSRDAVPEFSASAGDGSPGVRLYNPYQGIHAAAARGLAEGLPTYKLPQQPEFLFSEEAAVHRRSWSENLTFYTGSGYLSGAIMGGGKGALDALRTQPTEPALNTTRLKVNRLLNMSGKAGRGAGHALGALGLFFSSFESAIAYFSDRALPDELNTIAAGALTGALFRMPHGTRVSLVAGGIGAVAAGGLVFARANISRHL